MINIILMAHGGLAEAMLQTASEISGLDISNVRVFSAGCAQDCALIGRSMEKIFAESGEGALVLADMFGGSAANVPLQASKAMRGVSIITGLNLNMLLSALHNRGKMNINELAEKVEADGRRAVINVAKFLKESR